MNPAYVTGLNVFSVNKEVIPVFGTQSQAVKSPSLISRFERVGVRVKLSTSQCVCSVSITDP